MDDKVGCENDDESEKDGDQQTVAFMRRRLSGEFRKGQAKGPPNAINPPGRITALEQGLVNVAAAAPYLRGRSLRPR